MVGVPNRRFGFFVRKVRCAGIGKCWIWLASKTEKGYGRFWDGKKRRKAHRWFFEFVNGSIPEGFVLDHLCRNPACVNISHLEIVSPKENTLRGNGPSAINSRKVLCVRGHALSGENLYLIRGERQCKKCIKKRNQDYLKRLITDRLLSRSKAQAVVASDRQTASQSASSKGTSHAKSR